MKQYLITIDGGTTNTRAYLWNQKKECIDSVNADAGARLKGISDSDNTLEERVREMIEDLLEKNHLQDSDIAAIYASGMITSKEGLVELPHLVAPAGKEEFRKHLAVCEFPKISSVPIHFIRGLKNLPDEDLRNAWIEKADVCRGEETEILGLTELCQLSCDCLVILPGSHMKFMAVRKDGQITGCVTSLSGELLSAVTNHTILAGSLKREYAKPGYSKEMLKMGYDAAKATSLTRAAFSVRMLDMFHKRSEQECAAFLLGAVLQSDIAAIKTSRALCVDAGYQILIAGKEPFASALYCLFDYDGYFRDVQQIELSEKVPLAGYGALSIAIENQDFLAE